LSTGIETTVELAICQNSFIMTGILDVDIAPQVWLIVTADFELNNTTDSLELRQNIHVECLEVLVDITVFELQ
jgi:hypothetical protein